MRFLRVTLLLASATLAGCGAGGGGEGGGVAPVDAFQLTSTSATFTAMQGSSAPSRQFVYIAWTTNGPPFFSTSQTGTMFTHTLSEARGEITITPSAPMEAGSFNGTITVSA